MVKCYSVLLCYQNGEIGALSSQIVYGSNKKQALKNALKETHLYNKKVGIIQIKKISNKLVNIIDKHNYVKGE